jgi:hypothetical protein
MRVFVAGGTGRLGGTRRFIAQRFTGFTNEYAGTLVKTEEDPPNPDPPASRLTGLGRFPGYGPQPGGRHDDGPHGSPPAG